MPLIRVTAPYVTIKTVAATDGSAVRGFYEGAIVDVDKVAVEHLLRKGMVEEVEEEPKPERVREPSAKDVLTAVGEDAEAAKAALEAEQAKEKPRKNLVEGLEAVIAAADNGDDGSGSAGGAAAGNGDGAAAGDGK